MEDKKMYLSPDPIFLKLGFMEIRWYSVCIVTGIIAGFILVQKRLIKKGIDPDLAYDYVIVGLPLATITARAYYVIFRWDYYSANPSEIVKIWNGGLAIHGGLIGVLLTVLLVSRLKKAGVKTVASQSERRTIEYIDDNGNTVRQSEFEFVRFMEY